jgi:hypothetical protein
MVRTWENAPESTLQVDLTYSSSRLLRTREIIAELIVDRPAEIEPVAHGASGGEQLVNLGDVEVHVSVGDRPNGPEGITTADNMR